MSTNLVWDLLKYELLNIFHILQPTNSRFSCSKNIRIKTQLNIKGQVSWITDQTLELLNFVYIERLSLFINTHNILSWQIIVSFAE